MAVHAAAWINGRARPQRTIDTAGTAFSGVAAFAGAILITGIAAPAAVGTTVIHQKTTFMIRFLNMAAAEAGTALPDIAVHFQRMTGKAAM